MDVEDVYDSRPDFVASQEPGPSVVVPNVPPAAVAPSADDPATAPPVSGAPMRVGDAHAGETHAGETRVGETPAPESIDPVSGNWGDFLEDGFDIEDADMGGVAGDGQPAPTSNEVRLHGPFASAAHTLATMCRAGDLGVHTFAQGMLLVSPIIVRKDGTQETSIEAQMDMVRSQSGDQLMYRRVGLTIHGTLYHIDPNGTASNVAVIQPELTTDDVFVVLAHLYACHHTVLRGSALHWNESIRKIDTYGKRDILHPGDVVWVVWNGRHIEYRTHGGTLPYVQVMGGVMNAVMGIPQTSALRNRRANRAWSHLITVLRDGYPGDPPRPVEPDELYAMWQKAVNAYVVPAEQRVGRGANEGRVVRQLLEAIGRAIGVIDPRRATFDDMEWLWYGRSAYQTILSMFKWDTDNPTANAAFLFPESGPEWATITVADRRFDGAAEHMQRMLMSERGRYGEGAEGVRLTLLSPNPELTHDLAQGLELEDKLAFMRAGAGVAMYFGGAQLCGGKTNLYDDPMSRFVREIAHVRIGNESAEITEIAKLGGPPGGPKDAPTERNVAFPDKIYRVGGRQWHLEDDEPVPVPQREVPAPTGSEEAPGRKRPRVEPPPPERGAESFATLSGASGGAESATPDMESETDMDLDFDVIPHLDPSRFDDDDTYRG
jgi:hypothetical protein